MLRSEKIRVFTLVVAIAAVYIAAGMMTVRWARRQFTREAPPATPAEIRFSPPILALAGLGLLCMAYARFVEPNWLEVTHVQIESSKLQPGSRPIRIVQISDLHSESTPRLEERVTQTIAAERPDLIAFTGDAINPRRGLPIFQRCLIRLASTAPTFGVRGNWDIQPWEKLDLFGNTGAQELKGEAAKVKIDNTEVWVAGVPWGEPERLGEALSKVPVGAFTVLLYHDPDEIFEAAGRRVDLYLAGHTHGGQVALPFYGALMTSSKFDKRFEAGLHRVGQTWLYVNRGIGMEGGLAPRVRFFARPEITVIELSPAS